MSAQIDNAPNVQKHKKALNDNIIHMINSLEQLKYSMIHNDMNGLYSARFDIDITARVISRTTGCLARAIDSTFKTKKDSQPVPKSSALDNAVNPANQGLVDALIEKAESYPDNKVYQRNAYITVAEMVLNNEKSIGLRRIYMWRSDIFNIEGIEFNVGKSTGQFIINYLKDKPERVRIMECF